MPFEGTHWAACQLFSKTQKVLTNSSQLPLLLCKWRSNLSWVCSKKKVVQYSDVKDTNFQHSAWISSLLLALSPAERMTWTLHNLDQTDEQKLSTTKGLFVLGRKKKPINHCDSLMTILPLLFLLSEWTLDSYNVPCQIILWFLPKRAYNLICLYSNIINLIDWNFHMSLQLEAIYNCAIFTSGVQHLLSTGSAPLVCITGLATSRRDSEHPL